jgi:molybdopterin synthase sulfur carrier subunit
MIKVVLFASIRESLGTEGLALAVSQPLTVAALVHTLSETQGVQWGEVLGRDNVLVAVNQAMVGFDHSVEDDDEVAFFPPVTGG